MKKKRQDKKTNHDDAEQSRDFIKVAREIGADQESKADDVIGRLAKRPPDPRGKKPSGGN